MKLINLYIVVILSGLVSCSTLYIKDSQHEVVSVQGDEAGLNSVDSLVLPYKTELEKEMTVVIAKTESDLIAERPCGTLNNWAADAVLQSQIRNARLSAPTFCLLNKGGLRNTINKGDVTLGDLYKVMPFDNEIVWVELPVSVLKDIESYLIASGGEPIAGAKMINGKLQVDGVDDKTEKVWVITSDYLMNGGDRMDFFQKKISSSFTGVLLRDALIDEAKRQEVLVVNTENRMEF